MNKVKQLEKIEWTGVTESEGEETKSDMLERNEDNCMVNFRKD